MPAEVIDAESREVGLSVPVQPQGVVTLFGTDEPTLVVERAAKVADALMGVVRKRDLSVQMNGKQYLLIEAWSLLGSLVGCFPEVVWTRPVKRGDVTEGWEARAEVHTLAGSAVAAAESMCMRSEITRKRDGTVVERWKNAEEHAVRSMAQTRATSKAMATALRFIAVLAGFQGTPAEEIDSGGATANDAAPDGLALFDSLKETHDEQRWQVVRHHGWKRGVALRAWFAGLDSDTAAQVNEELRALTAPSAEPEHFGPCPKCGEGQIGRYKRRDGEVWLHCTRRRAGDGSTCQWAASGDAAVRIMESGRGPEPAALGHAAADVPAPTDEDGQW